MSEGSKIERSVSLFRSFLYKANMYINAFSLTCVNTIHVKEVGNVILITNESSHRETEKDSLFEYEKWELSVAFGKILLFYYITILLFG